MAVVSKKSQLITDTLSNRKPYVVNYRSPVKETTVVTAVTNGDSVNSVFLVMPIKTNDRVVDIRGTNEALGTGCKISVGLYTLASDGTPTAIASGNEFVDQLAVNTASATMKSIINNRPYANLGKAQWQIEDLASDPNKIYYIGIKIVGGDAAATGNIATSVILATVS